MAQELYNDTLNHESQKQSEFERGIVNGSREMRKHAAVQWCLKVKGLSCRDCDSCTCDFKFEMKEG